MKKEITVTVTVDELETAANVNPAAFGLHYLGCGPVDKVVLATKQPHSKIRAIRCLRDVKPELSLREAKNIIDAMVKRAKELDFDLF